MAILSGTLTADGDTEEFVYKAPSYRAEGVHFHASPTATFGGGTLQLSFKGADGNFHDIDNGSFTAATDSDVLIPSNTTLKGTLTGSTTPVIYWQFTDIATG